MHSNLFAVVVLLITLCVCQTQDEPGESITGELPRGGTRKKMGKGTGKRVPKKLRPIKANTDSMVTQALAIHYPLSFFDTKLEPRDWRTQRMEYNAEFAAKTAPQKDWLEHVRAQDQEDLWIYENWFYGMQHGIVIESGALDGDLFSTSHIFESFVNWTAIHVEADPGNYNELKRNRPNAINVNGALCSESRLLHYSSEGVKPVRGFIEFMTPSFIKQWHGRVYNNKTKLTDLPTVQCLPMKYLLRELNVKWVDLWVLDVEGAEESVLMGTDFESVHFNAVAMECDVHDVAKNDRKMKILEEHGFTCGMLDRNCMCTHKDFKPSAAPEKSVLKRWTGHSWGKEYSPTYIPHTS